jgi:hypothetical protein
MLAPCKERRQRPHHCRAERVRHGLQRQPEGPPSRAGGVMSRYRSIVAAGYDYREENQGQSAGMGGHDPRMLVAPRGIPIAQDEKI